MAVGYTIKFSPYVVILVSRLFDSYCGYHYVVLMFDESLRFSLGCVMAKGLDSRPFVSGLRPTSGVMNTHC